MERQLWDAVKDHNVASVKSLLRCSSTFDILWGNDDNDGRSVLHLACVGGDHEIVQLLLAHPKIAVNQRNNFGSTPLLLACYYGKTEVVKLLLKDRRVDINEANTDGITPIWWAANLGMVEVIKWMVVSGLPVDLKKAGRHGRTECTAVEVARMNGKTQVVALLQEWGKDHEMTRKRICKELGIEEFLVLRPPVISFDVYLDFLDGQTVTTKSTLSLCLGEALPIFAQSVPATFTTAAELTSVSFQACDLAVLPKNMDLMMNLEDLDLSFNSLVTLPDTLDRLAKLKTLVLHHNKLCSLPTWYSKFEFGPCLDVSFNAFEADSAGVISTIIKSASLRTLRLSQIPFGPTGFLTILQALVSNFSKQQFSIESIELDDVKLTSFEGLGMIPMDILQQGTRQIVAYLLDLFRSPDGDPLFRSKLMVVGFESVGKSSLLDCLFPLTGWLQSQGLLMRTNYWFKMIGPCIAKYDSASDPVPHKSRVTVLENRQWEVSTIPTIPPGIKVTPLRKREGEKELELYAEDKRTHETWLARLKRACMNEATHGIEIQAIKIDNEITQAYFKQLKPENSGNKKLWLTVWDFAGQNEYYNNHHFFLSTRTVFLVLWKLSDGEDKGLKGLDFWFRSLAKHLPSPTLTSSLSPEGTYYSIFVVGTHLDHPAVARVHREKREFLVRNLAFECGLIPDPIVYFEVSCSGTLENIEALRCSIFKTMLSHSYMGERIPKSYIAIHKYILKEKEERVGWESGEPSDRRAELPVIDISDLVGHFGDEGLVKRALRLLSLWGECVHFQSPAELSRVVILDPRFLTKGILADLFTSDDTIRNMKKDGVVRHCDLSLIWARFKKRTATEEQFSSLCSTFMTLLERLGVCFVVEEDADKPFMEQRSIIPALLPGKPTDPLPRTPGFPSKFQVVWPSETPYFRPVQIERVLKFTVVPAELVSRLLVHLHPHIQEGLVWKNEVVVMVREMEHSQSWLRAEVDHNRFVVMIRGTEGKECMKLLDFILRQVKEVAGDQHTAVRWDESVRSPHFPLVEIDLQKAIIDASKGLRNRSLACPETGLPIRAEQLLVKSGLLGWYPPAPSWWNFAESGRRSTRLMRVWEGQVVHDQELFEKFLLLFNHAAVGAGAEGGGGGDDATAALQMVERVYAVNNADLRAGFEIRRALVTKQHMNTERLFRRDAWRQPYVMRQFDEKTADPEAVQAEHEKAKRYQADWQQRRRFYAHLSRKMTKFRGEFNDGSQACVVPMIHGTSEGAAFRVIENGFGTVALDGGYYGRGIYFTSDLAYADLYAQETAPGSRVKVLLLSMVLPGNPFPVTEHPYAVPFVKDMGKDGKESFRPNPLGFLGQACKSGYQSHYTVVDSLEKETAFPTKLTDFDIPGKHRAVADELVVFEGSQTLPLFLVYYRATATKHSSNSLASLMPTHNPLNQVEDGSLLLEKLLTREVSAAAATDGPPQDEREKGASEGEAMDVEALKEQVARLRLEVARLEWEARSAEEKLRTAEELARQQAERIDEHAKLIAELRRQREQDQDG